MLQGQEGGGAGPCLQVGPRPRCTQGQPTQGCEPQGRRALLYGMGSTMQRCELSRRHRGAHSEACLRAITWQRMHAPYTACITSSCSRWVGRSRILRQRNNSRAAGATSSPRPLEVGGSYGKCLLLLCWNPLTIRASLLCPMVWQLYMRRLLCLHPSRRLALITSGTTAATSVGRPALPRPRGDVAAGATIAGRPAGPYAPSPSQW